MCCLYLCTETVQEWRSEEIALILEMGAFAKSGQYSLPATGTSSRL